MLCVVWKKKKLSTCERRCHPDHVPSPSWFVQVGILPPWKQPISFVFTAGCNPTRYRMKLYTACLNYSKKKKRDILLRYALIFRATVRLFTYSSRCSLEHFDTVLNIFLSAASCYIHHVLANSLIMMTIRLVRPTWPQLLRPRKDCVSWHVLCTLHVPRIKVPLTNYTHDLPDSQPEVWLSITYVFFSH